MLFVPLGSTDEIGASCHYLKIGGTGIILDVGQDPEDDGPAGVPAFSLIDNNPDWPVDHAVISHAHHDHIGALPILIKQFPHVMAHMTRATQLIAEFVLPASAKLQERRLREGSSTHRPMFTVEELEGHSYLYLVHELNENFNVSGFKATGKLTGRLFDAGHVLGSVGVLLQLEENGVERRIFYTGDTALRSQLIIPGGNYPEEDIDVLIMEGTLGSDADAELTTRKAEQQRLHDSIVGTIRRGGSVLIPVFALGRSQETLAMIDHFKKHGDLDRDVPVFTTGSMRAIADLYDRTRFFTPRLNKDFEVYGVEQRRMPRRPQATEEVLNRPSIHLAGSGMMFERTLSNTLAQRLIEDEKNSVYLVGFAKEESPADLLLRAGKQGKGTKVTLDAVKGPQPVNCEVERFRFSGHAHRRDLIALVDRLRPKKVILVHAETEAKDWLEDNIRYFYPDIEIIRPRQGVPVEV